MARSLFVPHIVFVLLAISAKAQVVDNVEVTIGFRVLSAEIPDNDRFRADGFDYGYGGTTIELRSNFSMASAGVKGEILLGDSKWSILAGVQYLQSFSRIDNKDPWLGYQNFFFYEFREEGTTTEYVTIENITQEVHYIGVPLQIRFSPFRPRRFNLYFMGGIEGNVLIASDTEIEFHERAMKPYESEITDQFGEPDPFNGVFYLGAGATFGRPGGVRIGIDVQLPAVFIGSSTGLVNPNSGGGVGLVISLPLTRNNYE